MQQKLTFWVEDRDLNDLKQMSIQNDRSLGYLVRKAIKYFIGGENGKETKTKEN